MLCECTCCAPMWLGQAKIDEKPIESGTAMQYSSMAMCTLKWHRNLKIELSMTVPFLRTTMPPIGHIQ